MGESTAFDADVVIVGAGYAGMVAAYRLWQKGVSVIVVEAMERVGGRSWSTNLSDGAAQSGERAAEKVMEGL